MAVLEGGLAPLPPLAPALLPLLALLVGGSASRGCRTFTLGTRPNEVCCEECHAGQRLVRLCGAKPEDLCTPCGSGTFSQNSKAFVCSRCTQCEGAQVVREECTASSDTRCACKVGLTCGDERCSFCRRKCGKGEEPADGRSCRACANGSFNDQVHHKCQPWSTKCPNPHDVIVAGGDAFTDIKCSNLSRSTPEQAESRGSDSAWWLVLSVLPSVGLAALSAALIVAVFCRKRKKRSKFHITPVADESSDDPKTLIATESSFHEAHEEQGSSLESLASKESREQLVV